VIVSSQQNPRVKQLRALRARKDRERTGLFFAEGLQLVLEAIQTGSEIELLVVAPELVRSAIARETVQRARDSPLAILDVSAEVFRDLAQRESTQGIGALVRQRWHALPEAPPIDGVGWVALAGTQYPGNLGTILRTADAVRASGVALLDATSDPYDPTAVRASVGAIFSVPVARATFAAFVAWTRRRRLPIVGTSPDGPRDFRSVRYATPLVLLMGSEGRGLMPEQLAACDQVVRIPMGGRCDSLNLAVATSVLLYEVFDQGRRSTANVTSARER
jgi:TrmH family RNA methyltransferase